MPPVCDSWSHDGVVVSTSSHALVGLDAVAGERAADRVGTGDLDVAGVRPLAIVADVRVSDTPSMRPERLRLSAPAVHGSATRPSAEIGWTLRMSPVEASM